MSTHRSADGEVRSRISVAALLLLAVGAFIIGAGIEAAPAHSTLLIFGVALLLLGHVAGTYPVLAGSHRGNGTLPSVAAAVAALSALAGWAQARYGLTDSRPWIVGATAIVVFGLGPWLAALSISHAKLPPFVTFRSAAATELATLGIAAWTAARGVTTELNGDSSWRLFSAAGALVLGVFVLPLASSLYAREAKQPEAKPVVSAPGAAPSPRAPLGDRIETWITALVRLLAAGLAAGVGYILWLDYRPGDGLVPLLITGGGLLLFALLGDRFLNLSFKGGTSPEVTIELTPKAGGPPPATGPAAPPSPPPTAPVAVLPSVQHVTADALQTALAQPFKVSEYTRHRRLIQANIDSSPVMIVGDPAELEVAREGGTLLHHAYAFADENPAIEGVGAEMPALRITAPANQIGDAVRAALNAVKATDS